MLVDRIEQVDKVKPARVLFGFTNFVQYLFSQSGDSINLGNSFQRDTRIKLGKRSQRDTRVSVVDVFAIGISLKKKYIFCYLPFEKRLGSKEVLVNEEVE